VPARDFVFNVLIEKSEDSNRFLAVCLELNIITEGKTAKGAEAGMKDAIEMYVESVKEHGDFGSLFRPAPSKYWAKLQKVSPRMNLLRAKAS